MRFEALMVDEYRKNFSMHGYHIYQDIIMGSSSVRYACLFKGAENIHDKYPVAVEIFGLINLLCPSFFLLSLSHTIIRKRGSWA